MEKGNGFDGKQVVALLIYFFLLMAGFRQAQAEEKYPSRPIEILVTAGPGGGADQLARKAGKLLEEELKTSFPVINVPGGTGTAAMAKLLAAPADGYTMMVLTGETYALLATSTPKWRLGDTLPLAVMMKQPSGYFVAAGSRFKTWADLEKEARAKPNTLKVAIMGFGSPDEMTANYFADKGVKLISVPYAKPGERYTSILGGHADVLYEQAGDIKSFLDSKQIRPLIFFGSTRMSAFKDIPASKELGYDIPLPQIRAIIMKAGTDPQKVKVISNALAKVAVSPEFKAYNENQWADEDSYIPAEHAATFIGEYVENMKKLAAAGRK